VGLEWPCRGWNGPVGALRAIASKPACMSCDGVRHGLVVMVGAGLLAIARSAPTAFARSAPLQGLLAAPLQRLLAAPLQGFHGPPGLARRAPLQGLLAVRPSGASTALQGLLAAPLRGLLAARPSRACSQRPYRASTALQEDRRYLWRTKRPFPRKKGPLLLSKRW